MLSTCAFADAAATTVSLTGGKGANLGELTRAGFAVPPGFVVTTELYDVFMHESGLRADIAAFDASNGEELAVRCGRIREAVLAAPLPAGAADDITNAYSALDSEPYVAVRSSGTLEDSSEASFAGMHDTYLDVRGADVVVAAVKRCWASLWTERAATYRQTHHIGHDQVSMAVVVQTMVASESSGVMFTGNPLTAANDEIVINASWGLGEAIVSGIVSPDQYTVGIGDLAIKERLVATKTVEVIRAPETGTVTRAVDAARQTSPVLTDDAVRELARLGLCIMRHYDGIPQDMEWGLVAGQLFVLQSRPITGVEFAWDCDVADWQADDEPAGTVWSRSFADEVWTGAITPLMFSWRGTSLTSAIRDPAAVIFGRPDLGKLRMAKYHKGEAYINLEADKVFAETAPPLSKLPMATKLPEQMRESALDKPFRYSDYLKYVARGLALYPTEATPHGWMNVIDDYVANRTAEADGLSDAELRELSDDDLRRYILKQIAFEQEYNRRVCWPGMFMYSRDTMTLLAKILGSWYDGDNPYAFEELITGSPEMTITVKEHTALHRMSRLIRESHSLATLFGAQQPAEFFANLADPANADPNTRELAAMVDSFLTTSGHRGHTDRDIYYPRYRDDPAILHRALGAHLKSDIDPVAREVEVNARRDQVRADVERNIRRKPLGALKVEVFGATLDYVLKFQQYRDDERHFIDRSTYSIRRAFLDVNRRLLERGAVETDRDFWFLTHRELFELLAGKANMTLTKAKIRGRMRNFDRFRTREWSPPRFIANDRGVAFDQPTEGSGDDAVLHGVPTSRGQVTATARIVTDLAHIDRVNAGEILIANSTDPGWTPVFAVISGVIVETGGMLSHSSCLAREYGFPAVQLEGALNSIPDGATIELDGDSGRVRITALTPSPA